MGRKSNFNAETAAKAINEFRVKKNGESFSKEELIAVFKESGVPTNEEFWKAFVKAGFIKRIYDNRYRFSNDKPVYYLAIDKVYRDHRARASKYNKNWASRKKSAPKAETIEPEEVKSEEVEEIDEKSLKALEKFSIEFLKELGYQIFKPVVTVYQKV